MLLLRELQVNRVAYQHSYSFTKQPSQAWTLLVQLSSAHDQLIAEMDNLDRITRSEAADLADFVTPEELATPRGGERGRLGVA